MRLSGKARLAGVMGWPVGHSRSPLLHGLWLEEKGVDGAYLPFAVRPENLAEALKALPLLGLRGVNLTIPHKEAALPLMSRLDDAARTIGAVNTVVCHEDGSLEGRNTDAFGFVESVRRSAPETLARKGHAVLLGAGGAARAVAYGLAREGFERITIVNRTMERGETLAADLASTGAQFAAARPDDLAARLSDAALLVNTTSLGMIGEPPLEIDLGGLPRTAAVADIVYAPLETDLLKTAAARGHPVVPGLWMLIHQARPGFEAWFGVRPEPTDAHYAALAADLAR